MESGWEEKKIQALFSELKATDEQVAPRFAAVWQRAQRAPRPIRAFNPAFVAATALLVFALASLAVWSRYSQRNPAMVAGKDNPTAIVTAPTAPVTDSGVSGTAEINPAPPGKIKKSRPIRLSTRNAQVAANQKLTRDAKAITSWESPTSALLTSPSDEIFTSLPQLDKSASDLKSFLPSRAN